MYQADDTCQSGCIGVSVCWCVCVGVSVCASGCECVYLCVCARAICVRVCLYLRVFMIHSALVTIGVDI